MDAPSSVMVKTLAKRFCGSEVTVFRREMDAVFRVDQPRVVFDLSAVTNLDSMGIEALLQCLFEIVRRDGELKLAALSAQAGLILEVSRVGRFFDLFPTVDDAVRSFDVFLPGQSDFPDPWNTLGAALNPNPIATRQPDIERG